MHWYYHFRLHQTAHSICCFHWPHGEPAADTHQGQVGFVILADHPHVAEHPGIPGVVAALEVISKKYGSLSLAENLQPAIELAQNGFMPGDHYLRLASLRHQALLASPAASKTFLHNGEVPTKNFVIRQPALAASLMAEPTRSRN